MLTKKDKDLILKAFKNVDPKKLELDHLDLKVVKWFRFGSFIGIDIASQIIRDLPEEKTARKIIRVT